MALKRKRVSGQTKKEPHKFKALQELLFFCGISQPAAAFDKRHACANFSAGDLHPATSTGARTWNLDLGLGLCQRLCLHPDHSEHVSRLATATKSFSMAIAKCRKKQKAYTIPDSFMNFTIFICFMSFSCFGFSLSSFRLLQLYLGIVCIFILFVQFLS